MLKFTGAALAVFSLGMTALTGGFGAATAYGASLTSGEQRAVLLPPSVIAAAEAEALIPQNYTIISEGLPGAGEEPFDAPVETARSLDALVRKHNAISIASREEECLAAAVYFEAKSESLDGQLAVAQVILNRAGSGRFPGSLCGVVFQPGQFSFVRGNGFPPIMRGGQDWREAVAIARIAREGTWKSKVSKALYFHASRVSPRWRLTRVASVGNHVFYH
jgi:hypothetical protein